MRSAFSILHITDFHISGQLSNGFERKIERAADAVVSVVDSERLYIIVSGDIAFSGDAKEYEEAAKAFSCIFSAIGARYEGVFELIMVPGNHDVNNPPEHIPENLGTAGWEEQLSKMDDFFCFANCMNVGWDDKGVLVVSSSLPEESGFSGVRFCCLNTAPFSTKTFDKGVHMLSRSAFSALRKDSPSELSVVVAHHGPEWLDDAPRHDFNAEALKSIDLLLVGHEHRGDTVVEHGLDNGQLLVFKGGTFSLDEEGECTFNVLNVGCQKNGFYCVGESRFSWDSSSRIFERRSSGDVDVRLKTLVPRPRQEYISNLSDEIGRGDFFIDSFSFPRLRSEVSLLPDGDGLATSRPLEIESADEFFSYLSEWDFVEIAGPVGSGKSCLAKDIYLECVQRGLIPVLIHPNNSMRAFTTTLSAVLDEQYGDAGATTAAFWQAPKEKRVIIADDFNRIKKQKRSKPERLVLEMLESFCKVVITVPDDNDAVARALLKGDASACVSCGRLRICACTKRVRKPLVTNLCRAAGLDTEDTERMVRAVDRAANAHAGLFMLTPAFVTQYVDYFLAHRVEMLSQEELPFRHIFDANIRTMLIKGAKSKIGVSLAAQSADVVIAALQDVALRMHLKRRSVMDVCELSDAIFSYAESRDVDVVPRDVLEVAKEAGILALLEDGYSYMFSSLCMHAYFVAKRINDALDLGEPDTDCQVDRLLDEICFPVNQEIIVFLAHLRLSADFPTRLIERARSMVGNYVPQDLLDPRRHASLRPLVGLEVSAMNGERSQKITLLEDRLESDGIARIDSIEYADYYDNDLRELQIPFVRALMAVKYAELTAGYLVKQFAKMPGDLKREIRGAVFQIPQAAAAIAIADIDSRFDDLVSRVADSLVGGIRDCPDAESYSRRLVAAISSSFLYGFMGTVISHAADSQVMADYLFGIEDDAFGYHLGELFTLRAVGESEKFVNLATSLANKQRKENHGIELLLIKVLVNQYLHENENINVRAKHRLLKGVFGLPGDSSNAPLGLRST